MILTYRNTPRRSIYYYIYNLGLRSAVIRLFKLFEKRQRPFEKNTIPLQQILSQGITRGYLDGGRLRLA
jgi:hypothetical protein